MALRAIKQRIGYLPPKVAPPVKTIDPFYLSSEWRNLVSDIKRHRGCRCEVQGCTSGHPVIVGDHIVERKDGGADLDPLNIMLMCLPCHGRKTAKERSRR